MLWAFDPEPMRLFGDSAAYVAAAQHLQSTGRLTPGLSLVYQLFVALVPWPLVVQSAMTIASGVLAYLRFGGRVGFWTGVGIAACPFFAMLDFRLLTESLYCNLLWWTWLALGWNVLAVGVLMGLAILARDTLLLLPAFAALWLRTKRMMIIAAIATIIALPSILQPEPGRFGVGLWSGTWERDSIWLDHGMASPDFPASAHVTAEELYAYQHQDSAGLTKAALKRMRDNPGEVLTNWAVRYPRLWISKRLTMLPFRSGVDPAPILFSAFALNLVLLIVGVWGLRKAREFAIPVVYCALFYIPFHNAETRYSTFALPYLIYAAALQLKPERGGGRSRSPASTGAGTAATDRG